MAETGLIKEGLILDAYVFHKGQNSSMKIFQSRCLLERAMIALMQENEPEASGGDDFWFSLSLRKLTQALKNQGHSCSPDILLNLLKSLSLDGRGLAGKQASLQFRHIAQDTYSVKLQRDWTSLSRIAEKRRTVARIALNTLLAKIPQEAASETAALVSFTSHELAEALRADLFLAGQITDMLAAIDRALMFLHEQKVIILQQGLAVFRQAMTISISQSPHRSPDTQKETTSRWRCTTRRGFFKSTLWTNTPASALFG